MKDLIDKFSTSITRSLRLWGRSQHDHSIVLLDSSEAAQESAFMLNGQWDSCNGVALAKDDQVAISIAVSLLGARWCYSGEHVALLPRLSVDELLRRYAAGDRNFINANLRSAMLNDLNLSEINLSWAKLCGANLSRANLTGSNLFQADLSETDLSGANLESADLRWANLRNVVLSSANLHRTNLLGADLRGTDLTGALLNG
jgi:uncharacterized protein YjbI with pentapeptide repeats